jgi:hypothetical protein
MRLKSNGVRMRERNNIPRKGNGNEEGHISLPWDPAMVQAISRNL